MKIGIFCSANNNIDNDYFVKTAELGLWMAQNGHSLVYGGCDMGLMKCIGDTVHNNGGITIGIVPSIIEKGGKESKNLDVHIPCDNLSDRKDLLLLHSDVIIALPGGIGSLDEIFTVAAAHTIGYHEKKVILYNINNFWGSTIAMLDDLQQKGMIRGQYNDIITHVDTFDELKALLTDKAI